MKNIDYTKIKIKVVQVGRKILPVWIVMMILWMLSPNPYRASFFFMFKEGIVYSIPASIIVYLCFRGLLSVKNMIKKW